MSFRFHFPFDYKKRIIVKMYERTNTMSQANPENMITLYGEGGEEVQFELLDAFQFGEDTYVILLPLDDDSSEVVILQIEDLGEEDEVSYLAIDDPELLQQIFDVFVERNQDRYNFNLN